MACFILIVSRRAESLRYVLVETKKLDYNGHSPSEFIVRILRLIESRYRECAPSDRDIILWKHKDGGLNWQIASCCPSGNSSALGEGVVVVVDHLATALLWGHFATESCQTRAFEPRVAVLVVP